jgi:hypothetical protein
MCMYGVQYYVGACSILNVLSKPYFLKDLMNNLIFLNDENVPHTGAIIGGTCNNQ